MYQSTFNRSRRPNVTYLEILEYAKYANYQKVVSKKTTLIEFMKNTPTLDFTALNEEEILKIYNRL